ncbi:MAG: AsmA family protein, partial [Proteobacteria bacterium]|nr:AsmA family protein [Pseudomonadota bacterium]
MLSTLLFAKQTGRAERESGSRALHWREADMAGWKTRISESLATVGHVARADALRLGREIRALRIRRPGKTALRWTASLFAVLSTALVVFFLLFEWNWLRGPIGRYASARLDREVRIHGDLDVKLFSRTPRATANGITVRQPAWAGSGQMAELQRLTVEVELFPLLRGQVRMPLLAVDRPVVVLRRDAQGRANWDFGKDEDKKEPAKLPPIRHFVINEGRLDFRDVKRGLTFGGTVSTSERSDRNSASAFRLQGKGQLQREPFNVLVTGGPLVNVRPDRPYPFDAEITAGPTRATARGSIPKPFDLGVFSMAVTLSGPDLAEVYHLTGVAVPNTPPYRLSAQVSRDADVYRARRLAGRVGDSDMGGSLTIRTGGKRLRLDADLVSRSLDFDDINAVLGGAPDPSETASAQQKAVASQMRASGRLLPDASLDVERLRAMDAEVRFRATQVKSSVVPLRALTLDLTLKNGVLTLDPLSFRFPQGRLESKIKIDGRGSTPVTSLDARLRGIEIGQFIPTRGAQAPLEGTLHARAKLTGAGESVHAAASNADGAITLVMPRGRMRQAFAELLGINAGKGLMLLLSKDQSETPVRCAVAEFKVTNGTLSAQRIIVDTGVVLASGSGTISLDNESMNLLIDGETKQPRL